MGKPYVSACIGSTHAAAGLARGGRCRDSVARVSEAISGTRLATFPGVAAPIRATKLGLVTMCSPLALNESRLLVRDARCGSPQSDSVIPRPFPAHAHALSCGHAELRCVQRRA